LAASESANSRGILARPGRAGASAPLDSFFISRRSPLRSRTDKSYGIPQLEQTLPYRWGKSPDSPEGEPLQDAALLSSDCDARGVSSLSLGLLYLLKSELARRSD
jgi:hypothetical protein